MEFKKEEIIKYFKFLGHNGISELRPIRPSWHKDKSPPQSFFINSEKELIKTIENIKEDYNVFLGINSRETKGKSDKDVKWIQNIGHDIDAHHGGKETASQIAIQIFTDCKKQGYQEPLIIDSGRGFWVIHHVKPIENTEENVKKIKSFGEKIAKTYGKEEIEMDSSVYNPSRIIRVPGTLNVSEENNKVLSKTFNEPLGIEDSKLTEDILNIEFKKYNNDNNLLLSNSKTGISIDSFINFCLTHKLPIGERHKIISKNVAIYLSDHPNKELLKEQYIKIQEGSEKELDNWLKQIEKNGKDYYKFGIGELVNFTKKYKIPFDWKQTPEYKEWIKEKKAERNLQEASEKEEKAITLGKAIKFFTNKKHLAEQFIKIQPLYYDRAKIWWLWNLKETRWEVVDEIDIMNEISKSSEANTTNSKEKNEILEALKQVSRANSPQPIKETWIQFKDLIIDIKTGEEIQATSKYFVTNPISYSLNKERYVNAPIMDKIFEEWVGKEYVQTLYEVIAYSLIPYYPLHRIFCFIGGGMNGKSCFLNLLKKFIGKNNCCSTELDSLLNSRFEVTRLHKKLICLMGETNFNEINKTSILKKLSGGDLIGFEYKNKNPFEEVNYAKIIIATNNLPTTTDKTVGFYRRWLIIDFPNQFSEKKDILAEIPEEEYEILAVKCLGILKDLLDKKEFHNEGDIEDRKEKYESRSNFLESFIKEYTIEDLNSYITKSDFFKKFTAWCKENRHREMSETSIGLTMKKIGIESDRRHFDWLFDGKGGQARVFIGIKWKEN